MRKGGGGGREEGEGARKGGRDEGEGGSGGEGGEMEGRREEGVGRVGGRNVGRKGEGGREREGTLMLTARTLTSLYIECRSWQQHVTHADWGRGCWLATSFS